MLTSSAALQRAAYKSCFPVELSKQIFCWQKEPLALLDAHRHKYPSHDSRTKSVTFMVILFTHSFYMCFTRINVGAPEECSPLSKTGQTEDKVNINGSHSPYISALCLPSDVDRTVASVQLDIAFCMTPIWCLASLYPQFIFGYLEFSFTPTSQ